MFPETTNLFLGLIDTAINESMHVHACGCTKCRYFEHLLLAFGQLHNRINCQPKWQNLDKMCFVCVILIKESQIYNI